MAEIGIIASVVQIADTGLRLSIKVCNFGEIVASADKSVLSISKDVSLASSVLKELGTVLASDNETKCLTETAVKTADEVVQECLQIFEEMDDLIIKRLPNLRQPGLGKASKATVLLERLKWPYLQPKLQLLQSNLDRLKSTILLMLSVISYARQIFAKPDPNFIIADQRSLIEDLAQSNQDYIRRFEALKFGSEAQSIQSDNSKDEVHGKSVSGTTPYLEYFAQEKNDMTTDGILSDNGTLFEKYTHFAGDTGFAQLQHYLSMLTAILKETNLEKYRIDYTRRAGVRRAIDETFNQEIDSLARPFGDECLNLVKDHFRSLMVASAPKFYSSPLSNPYQAIQKVRTSSYAHSSSLSSTPGASLANEPVVLDTPSKPQCWDHGCKGRQFSTFSNLLRHQRDLSGASIKSVCPRCGAAFTRKTARDGHLAHAKCKIKPTVAKEQSAVVEASSFSSAAQHAMLASGYYAGSTASRVQEGNSPLELNSLRAEGANESMATASRSVVDQLVALWTQPSVSNVWVVDNDDDYVII